VSTKKSKLNQRKPHSDDGKTLQKKLNDIRREMRIKRRALTKQQQLDAASQFAYYFCRSDYYRNCANLACYLATDGEISLEPVIARAWRDKKNVFLPVLHPFDNKLQFARYTADSVLVNNRFFIGEPAVAAAKRVTPLNMDIVLTPLVAFDRHGNRIGMGGGFYDRSFAFLKRRRVWLRPQLIGCAHSLQQIEHIQVQSWDMPLVTVFTDNGRV